MSNASGFQLASWLHALPDDALATLLDANEIGFSKRITDFYDLAAELLSERVREAELARLNRYQLAALAWLAEHPDAKSQELGVHLQQLFSFTGGDADAVVSSLTLPLIGEGLRLWPEHRERVRELWQQVENAPSHDFGRLNPSSIRTSQKSLLNPTDYLHALNELLHLIRNEPIRTKANGEPSESEFTRVGALMPPTMRSLLRPTLSTVANTKLIRRESGALHTTGDAEEFLQQSTAEQWLRLARFWVKLLPTALQQELLNRTTDADHSWTFVEIVNWLYPVNPSAVLEAPADTITELGHVLGLLDDSPAPLRPVLQELLTEALSGTAHTPAPDSAIGTMVGSFPADTSGLYLQTDLTAIAAGPIPNAIDFRLREFANKEGLGIAPRYRFSTESLNRAWRRGLSPDELHHTLTEVAIAEIPGSLRYLIDDSYRTFSSTLVEATVFGNAEPATMVRSTDEVRLAEIFVDPRLARFRWQRTPEGLISRSDAQLISEVLWDAGYPAKLVVPRHMEQRDIILDRASRNAQETTGSTGQRREQIALLRASNQVPDASSWALKQLSSRIGSKEPLLFTVELPQGIVQLELIPLGIAAGRLRARDVVAESERTLPLSRVLSIEVIPTAES